MPKIYLFVVLMVLILAACSSGEEGVASTNETVLPTATVTLIVPTEQPTTEPTEQPTVEPTAEPVVEEVVESELDAFTTELEMALSEQDYGRIEGLVNNPVGVGGWRSEWRMYTPAEMIAGFEGGSLPAPTNVVFTGLTDEEMTALIGQPPATMFSPDTNLAAALHSTGWGEGGADEAILFVVEEDGAYSWFAFLYTFGKFADANLSGEGEVAEAEIEFVMALQDVTMYDEPNESANVIGGIFDGQTAKVTGVDPMTGWWRVICPDDTIGSCWVTSDPAFTMPTTPPGQ